MPPLLLRLEWILLSIALLAVISPFPLSAPRLLAPDRLLPFGFVRLGMGPLPFIVSWAAIVLILWLGWLGRSLPQGKGWERVPYTALGFGLSWLTILVGGKGANVLPPLLLVVVLRGCLLFGRRDRFLTAGVAYGLFLLMQGLALARARPLGVPIHRLPLLPGMRRLPEEWVQGFFINAMLNASILFGLVLGFVLLLVGALLAEQDSRQELARANEQLRRYALRIEDQATLQERSRIAREMHDSVGHALTAQSIQLENVDLLLKTNPERATYHLQQARQMGQQAMGSVRQTVAQLRRDPLQNQSLDQALRQLLETFSQHTAIATSLHLQALGPLPTEVSTALYRITQEALTNITKHAQASQVEIALQRSPLSQSEIQLVIADNGHGFELQQNTTGFGLQSMCDRAEALGGTLKLTSAIGAGCRIEVRLPEFC